MSEKKKGYRTTGKYLASELGDHDGLAEGLVPQLEVGDESLG